MNKLLKQPKSQPQTDTVGRYERFHLSENPFPTEPVNRDSSDRRINGDIYEDAIRTKEYEHIENSFLTRPQSDRNHLRLGYICDTSYIGRGNGKSAFLVNLAEKINRNYCLDISKEINKCFAVYVTPEPGGRTKTFSAFLDMVFEAMLKGKIIDTCLAALRLQAACELFPNKNFAELARNDNEVVVNFNSKDWLEEQGISTKRLATNISENKHIQNLPNDFPFKTGQWRLIQSFVTSEDFEEYYLTVVSKKKQKHEFLLTHMVHFFLAAGFNGAYILVDDFERIPDFQSGRQRKDFGIELRSALCDGTYENSRIGFYNMILTLHAGVPQLVSDAWRSSGLENRYPIAPKIKSPHWIPFEKLTRDHVSLLLKKYLSAYRSAGSKVNGLEPFTSDAVMLIAKINENNAAKILQSCWSLLEKAADVEGRTEISEEFVRESSENQGHDATERGPAFEDPTVPDLMEKAREKQ